jgi:hypothetical protein
MIKHITSITPARGGGWKNYLAAFGLVEEGKRA